MDELARPFVRSWEYIGQIGGYPGQAFFVVATVMLVIGFLTWFSGKR